MTQGPDTDSGMLQCYASFYVAYAKRLASWGYAVVQYDTPVKPPYADVATEVCRTATITDAN